MVESDTLTKEKLIQGTPTPLNVTFIGAPTIGYLPLTVRFTDQTTGPTQDVREWTWDYGIPNVVDPTDPYLQEHSELQHPTRFFEAIGKYTIKLTTSNNLGDAATLQRQEYIVVLDPATVNPHAVTIKTMCVAYKNPNIIVVGGWSDGGDYTTYGTVQTSSDYGVTWDSPVTVFQDVDHLCYVRQMIFADNGDLIAVGSNDDGWPTYHAKVQVGVSHDNGATWTVTTIVDSFSMQLDLNALVKTSIGTLLFTQTYWFSTTFEPHRNWTVIYRSTDNGVNWSNVFAVGPYPSPSDNVPRFHDGVALANNRIIMGGWLWCHDPYEWIHSYYSDNDGEEWYPQWNGHGIGVISGFGCLTSPNTYDVVAGTHNDLHYVCNSTTNGDTWSDAAGEYAGPLPTSLQSVNGRVYGLTGTSLYVTDDLGATWVLAVPDSVPAGVAVWGANQMRTGLPGDLLIVSWTTSSADTSYLYVIRTTIETPVETVY